ncbi:ead/Ea22-like family protein [Klebsiella pneumoniae]|uniref:ead/Ea22-like family protein n=1 Tax=Klebsiella pneumoniae TaxID=573 RepID=UPI002B23B2BF|nr:ead/Ea22-like family protein [Klebsiella pneumoniae]
MTDITELAQSLKAAAENAIGAHERLAAYPYGEIIDISQQEGEQIDIDITDINEFLEEASPANILALVDALEKAQQQMTESENRVRKQNRHICELFDDNTALRQRIAGLEASTVTVKQGEVLVTVAGFTGCGKSAIAGEIEIAMKAIGLPVTWANGDSEKRMTGADWLTAIEMYKPTVRIVEVNIPRAAGIKVEAE